MVAPSSNYGTTRERAASVSFADIERVARQLMLAGDYPSVLAVRKELKRGSTTTIAEAMRRFWKDQAALNVGNPVALTRLPPEFADAAVVLWEQALRLSQQTAMVDDNAARARLEELRREATLRIRSVELREKEWDMAARVRDRALADTREQVGVLVGELAAAHAEIRSHSLHTAEMQTEIEHLRQQLATVIARAVARHRSRPRAAAHAPIGPNRGTVAPRRRLAAVKARARPAKRALSIKSRLGAGRSAPKGKATRRPAARRRR
jgi:Plasmid replication region DNA-binding N-term